MTSRPEPVLILDAVKALIAVGTAYGVIQLDDATTSTLATALGGLLFLVASWATRNRVTPTSDPVDASGALLQVRPTVAETYGPREAPPTTEPFLGAAQSPADFGYGQFRP